MRYFVTFKVSVSFINLRSYFKNIRYRVERELSLPVEHAEALGHSQMVFILKLCVLHLVHQENKRSVFNLLILTLIGLFSHLLEDGFFVLKRIIDFNNAVRVAPTETKL
jgi:membrane-bound metal-dependent hydrolase YbcI (DUF457 family)